MPTEIKIGNLGANIDTRPEEAKQKDHNIVEIVASVNVVDWKEKKESQWRKFMDQDQDGSGSCVANTVKKSAQVMLSMKHPQKLLEFSATSIYQYRSNRPSSGMIGIDAFDIWMNKGITLEALVPGELMNDSQMDKVEIDALSQQTALSFRIGGHVGIPNKDIETVASVIQTTGKAVMVWFYFTSAEWSKLVPEVKVANLDLYAPETARHSVAALDFFLYKINGKLVKCLLIEDSAHFGGLTRRIITEDFFKARNWFSRYPMNYKFLDQTAPDPVPTPDPVPAKPKYTFAFDFEFIALDKDGNISDLVKNEKQKKDVMALQDILRYEGFYPMNTASTGYYGAITAKAVLAWQTKHNVASQAELSALAGKRVGPATRKALNAIYA